MYRKIFSSRHHPVICLVNSLLRQDPQRTSIRVLLVRESIVAALRTASSATGLHEQI